MGGEQGDLGHVPYWGGTDALKGLEWLPHTQDKQPFTLQIALYIVVEKAICKSRRFFQRLAFLYHATDLGQPLASPPNPPCNPPPPFPREAFQVHGKDSASTKC